MMDKQRLKKAMAKMASMETNKTKWEEKETIEHLTTLIGIYASQDDDSKWFTKESYKEACNYLRSYILSTLQEYSEKTTKILKGYIPSEEKIWQELEKLKIKWGIK